MTLDAPLLNFPAWLSVRNDARRPWLLVGPEATKAACREAAQLGYALLTTGEAAGRIAADVAVVVDLERLIQKGDAVIAHAAVVAVPNDPHMDGWSTGRALEGWIDQIPALQRLAQEKRLLGFDLWTARRPSPGPVCVVGDFRGDEVPLRLLAAGGVRTARHVGFPPRADKSGGFEASHSTLKRATGGVPEIRRAAGLSYGPFGFPVPARVFAGTDDEQMLGVKVLHYSIEQHSSMDVTVEPLDWRAMPVPKEPANRSRTGFSFCRFDIPRLCGYAGRGVYVDADMQVFTDIADLWTLPLDQADVLVGLTHPSQGRTRQTSVMLLSCEALRWDVNQIVRDLDEGAYSYKELMSDLCIVPPDRVKPLLPYWWNSLELYEPGRTSLLHYTDMHRQPWVSPANPNGDKWYGCCAEAIAAGFISVDEVAGAVEAGHVSPQIFSWIGLPAPKDYREQSATWVAPFNRFVRPRTPEGVVDLMPDNRLVGWAWDPARPDEAIEVGVYDGDDLLFAFSGGQFGELLRRYGKGDGRHAFNVALPEEILMSNAPRLSVRTLEGRMELKGSPVEIYR